MQKYVIYASAWMMFIIGVLTSVSSPASQFFNFKRRLGTSCELQLKTADVKNELIFAKTGVAEIDEAVKLVNARIEKTPTPHEQSLEVAETRVHDVVKISSARALDVNGDEQLTNELTLSQDTPEWPLVLEMTIAVKTGANDYVVLSQTTNYSPRCRENVVETVRQNLHVSAQALTIHAVEVNPVSAVAQTYDVNVELPAGAQVLPVMPHLYGVKNQRALYISSNTRTFVFGSHEVPLVELVAKPRPSVVRFNTLTAAYESLDSVEVNEVIDGQTIATNVIDFSKVNAYGEDLDAMGVRNFTAPEKMWRARLLSGTTDNLSTAEFDESDFKDGNNEPLAARFATNQEMGYGNFEAYWHVKSQTASDIKSDGKTGREYVYELEARKAPLNKDSVTFVEPADRSAPFLRATQYVQPDLPEIQALAKKLKHNFSGTRLQMAQKILHAMPKLIDFDDEMIDENDIVPLTTAQILQRGKGVCQHFANVYAAVARAVGLPTKIISGFTFEVDSVFGHAWNEVEISPGRWLPLEPQYDHVFDMPYWQYLPLAISAELDDPTRKDDLVREDWLLANFVFSLKKEER